MKRPKNPADKRGEDPTPPGGRARKRIEQFERARGLTEDPPDKGREDAPDEKDAPPKNKP